MIKTSVMKSVDTTSTLFPVNDHFPIPLHTPNFHVVIERDWHIHTHTHTHAHTHAYTHTHARARTHTHHNINTITGVCTWRLSTSTISWKYSYVNKFNSE